MKNIGVFFVFQLLALSTRSQSNDACYTPRNEPGTCVDLDKCNPLIQILKKRPIPGADLDLLRQSSCGFNGNNPKVCCPSGGIVQPPVTQRPVTQPPIVIPTLPPNSGPTSNLLPGTDVCGVETIHKIYGGEATELDEFPWMALLEYQKPVGRGFYCGGVLISSRYVLTAAHCVKGKDIPKTWSLVSVRLGEHNTETDIDCLDNGFGGQECAPAPINIPIEEQISHEDYVPTNSNQYNDIALLRLARDITFSDYIKPICLPGNNYPLNSLYVAGWGKTESKSESNVKLKVTVPLVTQSQCNPIYSRASVSLGNSQICAGGQKGKDSCRGDSGGPLMTVASSRANGQPNWYAVGVVSFGPSPCGMQGWPGVYTKVADYIPWIQRNLRA
ncbi:easter [Carabus blaptoides fortunei]